MARCRAKQAATELNIDIVFIYAGSTDTELWPDEDIVYRCEPQKFTDCITGVQSIPVIAGKLYTVKEPFKEPETVGGQYQVYMTKGRGRARNKKRK